MYILKYQVVQRAIIYTFYSEANYDNVTSEIKLA